MASSYAEAHAIIYARLRAGIKQSSYQDIPILYPNIKSTQPTTDNWLRVQINDGDCLPASLGNARYRYSGVLSLQIFREYGKGDAEAYRIADTLVQIFQGYQGQGISFAGATVRDSTQDEEWLQLNIVFPFTRDNT